MRVYQENPLSPKKKFTVSIVSWKKKKYTSEWWCPFVNKVFKNKKCQSIKKSENNITIGNLIKVLVWIWNGQRLENLKIPQKIVTKSQSIQIQSQVTKFSRENQKINQFKIKVACKHENGQLTKNPIIGASL